MRKQSGSFNCTREEAAQRPEAQESTLVSLNDPLSSDSVSVAVAPLFLLTRK
jgi:hypothetical protein